MMRKAALAVAVAVLAAATPVFWPDRLAPDAVRSPTAPDDGGGDVVASARLTPDGGMLEIGASVDLGTGIIDQLMVREGETVTPGQPMATLGSHRSVSAALAQAQAQVAVARARREQAISGALKVDIATRDAEVEVRRIESVQADLDFNRAATLHTLRDIATSTRDERRLSAARAQLTLLRAERQRATAIATRDDAIRLGDAELAQAQAAVERGMADVEQTIVRAPRAGTVLRILARAGERIGLQGLLQLGDTRRGFAVAEVFVGDLPLVAERMPVTVSGGPLAAPMEGVVERISLVAGPRRMDGIDGASVRGERVAEVWISLTGPLRGAYGSIVRAAIHTRAEPVPRVEDTQGNVAWQPPSPR